MEKRCPRCGGELKPTTHRAEGGARRDPKEKKEGVRQGDQKRCFNGLLKSDHICVATCSKPGLFCVNCRNLIDISERKEP